MVPIPGAMPCPCIMDRCKLAQSRFNLDLIWFWSRLKGVLQSALYTLVVGLQLYWLVYLSPLFCSVTGVVLFMVCMWMCACVFVMHVNKGMIEVCKCAAVFSFFPSLCSTGSQLWYLCKCIYRCRIQVALSWIQHQLKHSYLGITSLYPWS